MSASDSPSASSTATPAAALRVLMLGWDFSPRLSGGVGTACRGLAEALARQESSLATEVLFVLPRLRGDEDAVKVRLLSGDGRDGERTSTPPLAAAAPASRGDVHRRHASAPEATPAAPPEPARERERSEEARAAQPERPADEQETTPAPAQLPTPAEALRLLTIDSPLRPYLSPADYAGVVHELFARFRRQATSVAPAAAPVEASRSRRTGHARARPVQPLAVPASAPTRVLEPARPATAPHMAAMASVAVADVPVPPYGSTLDAEVERYARAVLARVQHEPFDVIHAHDWMSFPAALLLKERTGKPLIVHFHSSERERRGQAARAAVRAIEQAAIEAAERVVCVSEASARSLRAEHALEYAKLRVLHNAYEPLPDRPPRHVAEDPVVLYLGRLSEQKGPDVFLRAAATVHARQPRARFVLAGEGELYPELVQLARDLELEEQVTFTGFLSGAELARAYAGADVYVLASTAEPFGISALEALSLGVPTIVPRGAGVTEVVRSVLRFPEGDTHELAEKIVALLERPALRAQLSAAGLREVKNLRWDRPARALRGIYGEIAKSAS